MRSSSVLQTIIMIAALAGFPSLAMALHHNIIDRICIPDAVMIPQLKKQVPVPVGCEIIDCCPGCPGGGPFEWRITVDAKILDSAELRFEGMSAAELRKLKVSGNARIEGNRILLRRGTSRVAGVPERIDGKVAVGSLLPIVRKDAAARLRALPSDNKTRRGAVVRGMTDQITVEQYLGSFQINNFRWAHIIRRCELRGGKALQDRLKIEGLAPGEKVVVMIDARTSSGTAGCRDGSDGNEWVFRSAGNTPLGNLLASGTCNSEVAIFSENHKMALEKVSTWTNNRGDVHTVTLEPVIDVPVSVWIADNAPDDARAREEIDNANRVFTKNLAGMRFHPVTYTNVSGDTAAVKMINAGIGFLNDDPTKDYECRDLDTLKQQPATAIFPFLYTAKALNIYYVSLAIYGRNCAIKTTPSSCPGTGTPKGDGNITYIGSKIDLVTLPHELGHAFGLRPGPCHAHTDPGGVNLPGFHDDNVMRVRATGTADHFSLGQVYRMNTHKDEWGGTMLIENELRPETDRRECTPQTTSNICPALSTDWPP